jgi:hypothetical protein
MKSRKFLNNWSVLFIIVVIFLLAAFQNMNAQPPPPRPLKVTKTQDLSFGTFYQGGGGGTVTIQWNGTRSQGGSVVLFGGGGSAAIFEIVAHRGTVISFLKPTGSLSDGSGHSISLQIASANPDTPFVTTNNYSTPTPVRIGGILTIGSPVSNPPGSYSGTFAITFVQE